jgi:hypothetical protein
MPTFDTPGPIAATVVVGGAQVQVTASDRTDTVVLVEPIDKASRYRSKQPSPGTRTGRSSSRSTCPQAPA